MLEIAIVGGGLCGLALAEHLRREGRDFALFEARPRLGGRIDSQWSARSGMRVDLGPAWFWPGAQPMIAGLVEDLELATFDQHETGEVLHLQDVNKVPDVQTAAVHAGARRLTGGMASLVDALVARLPQERIHLTHELASVKDCGDYVQLLFLRDGQLVKVTARTVVLAVPPRLLEDRVLFEPELCEDVRTAMGEAATWMAGSAKVVLGYDRPFWRDAGHAGNAFVSHGQTVVGEIFDACDATGNKAALGGFLALGPDDRERFNIGLPMLMGNQLAQVFGAEAERGELLYRDWATERLTCSARDRREPPTGEHAGTSNPLLRRSLWGGRLHLSGSETAARGCGYLEGALEAAAHALAAVGSARESGATGELSGNAAQLAQFETWVRARSGPAFDSYRRNLTARLSEQERDQLTQLSLLETVEEMLDEALVYLGELDFDIARIPVENGRSALMSDIQSPFRDFLQILMDDVIAFNRTSCALSNFPHEHQLSNDYKQTILRDVAAAWRAFSLAANRLLLSKTDALGADLSGSHSIGKLS
ncbi:flavin monoamine oxidase family protein [Roseibium marinum]|uniref:Monoamine oxidase n=1 Tax=Roseibium marinum TaxID=281252 RepID=A0A2S3V1J6_9HYPH|nr:FAD-dependent oxidoreductase [Roseibium marinum]POF33847.1 monoamine oxidase [Roseibium marinum]